MFDFLRTQRVGSFKEVTQEHIDRYLRMMQDEGLKTETQIRRLESFVLIWRYREYLTGGGLTFEPFRGRSLQEVVGHRISEYTTTPRIPEDVLAGLTVWAMAYIEDFKSDIVSGLHTRKGLETAYKELNGPFSTAAARGYLQRMKAEGKPLPCLDTGGPTPPLSTQQIAFHLGCSARALARSSFYLELVQEAQGMAREPYRPARPTMCRMGCRCRVAWAHEHCRDR